ncbi:hypothetical protein VPH35_120466 [Triticum aestivum]|uniref:UBX domain-containing protein n=1 Tax=Triticum turgidum subsp. durum TaxID=4567 RepID=A0A9R0Z2F6_TRITD|nr:unnamed protein product [Triticum turgidum subsp. durum]
MDVDELMASFAAVTMHGSNRPQASGQAATVDELTAYFRAITMHDAGATATIRPQVSVPVAPVDQDEPAMGEEACTLRVRLPDGRFICKTFGAGRPATALFRYCHSALAACSGGAAATPPFRLLRLAGGQTDEIRPDESPLRDLGLHHCTIHLVFWV